MLAATGDGVGAPAPKHELKAGVRSSRDIGISLPEAVQPDVHGQVMAGRVVNHTAYDNGSAAQGAEIRQSNDHPAAA